MVEHGNNSLHEKTRSTAAAGWCVLALAWLWLLPSCGGNRWAEVEGRAMGMQWRIQAAGVDPSALRKEAETCFERWDKAASLWRADSDIVRFNQAPAGRWMEVSEELWKAVTLALEVARETENALDATLGAVVSLWGFGPGPRRETPPDSASIEAALQVSRWRHLDIDFTWKRLKKRTPELRLDVNSVVEGLALDELALSLKNLGCHDFLLELGGELLATGSNPKGQDWTVAVQSPGGKHGDAITTFTLRNEALATSGTYRSQFSSNGVNYSHVLNPMTGVPVNNRLVSVSVTHPSCARADAYATALLILGTGRGKIVAEKLQLKVFWVEKAK